VSAPAYFETGATFGGVGQYRYTLRRRWRVTGECVVCWVMLNPSTADAKVDDPTIRRCVGFSQAWGYDALIVVNLFAVRAPSPKALILRPDFYQSEYEAIIGPENDATIERETSRAQLVVAAWGNHGALYSRDRDVRNRIEAPLHYLGLTKMNQPRHPLYVSSATKPMEWVRGVASGRIPEGEAKP